MITQAINLDTLGDIIDSWVAERPMMIDLKEKGLLVIVIAPESQEIVRIKFTYYGKELKVGSGYTVDHRYATYGDWVKYVRRVLEHCTTDLILHSTGGKV